MSRINRDIYTSLDINGPYIRIDTQPVATTLDHNGNAVFTLAASTYYLTGDEAEIGDIDVLETDAVAPTDASLDNQTPGVPHTAKNDGYISYQWYQIDANSTPIGEVTKLTDSLTYTGTTTNTLTVNRVQSPGTHLNQYYCILDYIPTLTNNQYDTGNAVNDTVTSDTVTLNVRPFLTITENPETNVIGLNPDIANFYATATLSDTRTPWENYKLEYQWWEKNTLNAGDLPNIRLEDGDFRTTLSTERTEEAILNETQRTTLTESVSSGRTKTVGIPTEAVSVTVTISGAEGGKGGDENRSILGGLGGRGRDGKFSFSNSEIVSINNSGSPLEYKISSGSKGDDGSEGIVATGGLGGLSFDDNTGTDLNDSVFGGKGGDSGPGGVSGSGAGGGGGTGLIRYDGSWIAIAGAGGGGGGASEGAPGGAGLDAQSWGEFTSSLQTQEVKQATVANYNPKAGTRQGGNVQDRIEYGIYIKSSSPISTVEVGVNYRVIVVWNNQEVISTTTTFATDLRGLYIQSGNVKYHISTHRGSQLGWCNDETNLQTICIRGDGEYVNAFDVFTSSSTSSGQILPFDGGNGTSKILGDGGGGGGAGGGSNEPKSGGSPGADPIPSDEVDVIFKLFNNSDIGSNYIEFVEKPWYGFGSVPTDNRRIRLEKGSTTTQTVRLKTGHVYDVYSNFEDGGTPDQPARTSDTLRILQDLTPDANLREVIAGRSVGLSLSADAENIQTGDEDDFRDFIVSVSDGTFDVVPQTVRLDDDEILGKSIIRYTAPTSSINSVRSTGGQGGGSQYNSTSLVKFVGEGDGLSRGQGAVNMTIVTEQPYNVLEEDIIRSTITRNYSIRGAHPYTPYQETGFRSNLSITSDYIFSKRILCQVTVKDTSTSPASNAITSGPNTRYTTDADFIVTDSRDATITVEQIRQNDDFAILKGLNLYNGDITFEKSNLSNLKETRYYSFYSNKDIEVDIQMYGGKGVDNGSYSGGNGGWTYLRLNMIANTEYVIAGLDDVINTPFLFKKGQLLACVGGGGNANSNGPGGRGGGVGIDGETPDNGGTGGVSPSSLTLNGILGSASLDPQSADTSEPYADSKADIPFGGRTTSCSKGNLYYFGNQPSPCQDRGSAVKFATGDGTLVSNTKEINRGFKAGYNIFNTAGRTPGISIVAGRGGCGAQGGNADARNLYGGGGGSGYIAPDLVTDIFVRSEGNALISDSSYTDSGKQGDENDTLSSTRGGSNGPAKVILSRAEIPTRVLPEFIERPANPLLDVSEEDVERELNFIPLPEIVAPPPIDPPNPRMSITSIVSKGFTGGDRTYTSFDDTSRIDVLETGSVDINIKTEDIPPNVKFYWKVFRLPNSSGLYDDNDFDSVTGDFITTRSGSDTISTFNISPDVDTETDFIGGNQDWYVKIYTDSNTDGTFNYQISPEDFTQKFRIKDNSLSAPVVTFDLNSDRPTAPKVQNTVIEGVTRTVTVGTQNIQNGDSIKWYITHNGTTNADFSATEGTITVTSGFTLDADGVAESRGGTLAIANLGRSSFTFTTIEDQSTEGIENFGFQIEYPVGSGNIITNTLTGSGDDKKTFNLVDTSLVPVAEFSTTTTSIDEGSSFTFTLNTQHFFTGDTFFWKILSATTDDFAAVTGEVTVTETDDSSPSLRTGTTSITITTEADSTTEGPESYTLALYKDSGHTTNLNTVGNVTHATTSFTINDISLGPREFGGFVDGLVGGNTNEDNVALTFQPQAWNLTAYDSDGVIYYWQVLRSDGTVPVTQSSWGAVGDDRTIEPEFNSIQGGITGQFTFTIAGYTKTKGSTSEGIVTPATGEYIYPYHVANTAYVSDDRVFSTIRDYLNDDDKSYYVAFYGSAPDRTNRINVLFETSHFTVTNSSRVHYAFNKNRGWGVTNTTGKNATNPTIIPEDNQIYYFRVETSAPVGTTLYYNTIGTGTAPASSDDFVRIYSEDLPSPLDTSVSVSGKQRGSITTFDIDFVGNVNQTTDSGKIRSIAYIPVKILADEVTDGKKTFALSVYTLAGRTIASRVLIDTIEIEDSSVNLPDSTVALKITNKGSATTWSGSQSGANYAITRSPGAETGIRLSWDITNADLIEDYEDYGNGFGSDYFLPTDRIDLRDKRDWYSGSSYLEGTIESADPAPGGDDTEYTLDFELEVQRRLGVSETGPAPTSSSSITLRVITTAPAALPVADIQVDDSNIKMGDVVNISYESENGTSYALEKRTTGDYTSLVAEPGSRGNATDRPLVNTQYRYTVTGAPGTTPATDEVTVNVSTPDAPTASLSINTGTIQSGGTAYLSWTGTGEYISSQSLTRIKDGSSVTVSSSLTGEEVGDSPTELGDYTYKFSVTNPNSTANAYVYLTVEAAPADDPPVPFIRVDNTTPAKNSSVVITYGGNKGTHDLSSGVLYIAQSGNGSQSILNPAGVSDPPGTELQYTYNLSNLPSWVGLGLAKFEYRLKDSNNDTESAFVDINIQGNIEDPIVCTDDRAINFGEEGECIFTTFYHAKPVNRYVRTGGGSKPRFMHHPFGPGSNISGYAPPSHTSGGDDAPHGKRQPLFFEAELAIEENDISKTGNGTIWIEGGRKDTGYQLPSTHTDINYRNDVKAVNFSASIPPGWSDDKWNRVWSWHWGRAMIRYNDLWDYNVGIYLNAAFENLRYDELVCGAFPDVGYNIINDANTRGYPNLSAQLNTNLSIASQILDADGNVSGTIGGGLAPEKDYGGEIGVIPATGFDHYVGLDGDQGHKFYGWPTYRNGNAYAHNAFSDPDYKDYNQPVKVNPDFDLSLDPNRWPYQSMAWFTERTDEQIGGIPHGALMNERIVIVCDRSIESRVPDRNLNRGDHQPGLTGSGQRRFLTKLHDAQIGSYHYSLNYKVFPNTIAGEFAQGTPAEGVVGLNDDNIVKIESADGVPNFPEPGGKEADFPKITWDMPKPDGIYHYLNGKFYNYQQTNYNGVLPDWHPYYDENETDNNRTIRTIKNHPTN